MRRACVFVDGENFRYSLKQLFPSGRYTFGKGDYLPETDWHGYAANASKNLSVVAPAAASTGEADGRARTGNQSNE